MTDNSFGKLLYMPPYPKQRLIIEFLNTRLECTATLDEMLCNLPEIWTAHNSKGYLGQTMSRMIKKGLVQRVGKGKYKSNCAGMEKS